MSAALVMLTAGLPHGRLKRMLLRRLGWKIGQGVHIGPVVAWRLESVRLADGSRIGFGNVFRNFHSLELDEYARLGQWNWATAGAAFPKMNQVLRIGQHGAVTSRHYLDCSGGISIGEFSTIAGVRSTFITHGIDPATNRQTSAPISIGPFNLVGSNVKFVPGAQTAPRVQIAMGAVVVGELGTGMLHGGVPAKPIRPVSGAYFERERGYVD